MLLMSKITCTAMTHSPATNSSYSRTRRMAIDCFMSKSSKYDSVVMCVMIIPSTHSVVMCVMMIPSIHNCVIMSIWVQERNVCSSRVTWVINVKKILVLFY